MVQTRPARRLMTAQSKPEPKPEPTPTQTKKVKTADGREFKREGKEPEVARAVPEKRKRDDKDIQPGANKAAKEDNCQENGRKSNGEKKRERSKEAEKIGFIIAHKIRKIIDEYGTTPLEGLGVDKPLEPVPAVLLAIVIDSMLKSTRISHIIAQKTSIRVFEAGYHEIETLSKSTWDDRVQVLSKGGYNRYRETTATKLGDLANLVNEKYDDDLNNLLKNAANKPSKIRQLIREVKGFGDVATGLFCNDAQAVWPVLAPTIDHRSLGTAEQVGIGTDIDAIYAQLGRDPLLMSKLARGLSAVRLSRSQGEIEEME